MSKIVAIVAFTCILGAVMVSADNSTYFDCQCYDGQATTSSDPTCTCDCSGAGTAKNGESYLSPFCAYPTTGIVKMTIVTNSSNSSEFSGSYLEKKLKATFGLSSSSSDISFSRIDDSSRSITNHYKPFIACIFNIGNGSLASTMINTAKAAATYNTMWAPLGVWEVEPFYRVADDSVVLSMGPQWVVLMVIFIIVAIIESCIASGGGSDKVAPETM